MKIRSKDEWRSSVEATLWARFGVEPVGPGIPELLDEAFAAKKSAVATVEAIGKRFRLAEVQSWKERGQ